MSMSAEDTRTVEPAQRGGFFSRGSYGAYSIETFDRFRYLFKTIVYHKREMN